MSEFDELEYFHGSIDMVECKSLLIENGDYLIRNKMRYNLSAENVIAVLCVGCRMGGEVKSKSIGIVQVSEGISLQGFLETYPTVKAMIDALVETRKPIFNEVFLIRPVMREKWELMASDVTVDMMQQLGKGSFGAVFKGMLLKAETPKQVAIKVMTEGLSETVYDSVLSEARIMRTLDHNNVIFCHGVVINKEPLMIVIDLIDGSSLVNKLKRNEVHAGFRMSFVFGILYGLCYVHNKKIIHRDIAARNVLISHDCREVKIIDFGLAKNRLHYSIHTAQKIPTKWLSPEVIHSGKFSNKSDLWAFGVTIWEIFNDGAEPYPNLKCADVKQQLSCKKGAREVMLQLGTCSSQEKPPPALDLVLRQLFEFDPKDRPNTEQLLEEFQKVILPRLPPDQATNCNVHRERKIVENGFNLARLTKEPKRCSKVETPNPVYEIKKAKLSTAKRKKKH